METTVKDIMSTQLFPVEKTASFKAVALRLRESEPNALPVVDADGRVIGIISGSDLLPKEAQPDDPDGLPGMVPVILHHEDQEKAAATTAADLMTSPAVTVRLDDTVKHAACLMYIGKVQQLPVVDADGRPAGIVSRTDVLGLFDRADQDIHDEIVHDLIQGDFRQDPSRFMVTVTDSVVTLEGHPDTIGLGHQLASRVRHVHGVVAVQNLLSSPVNDACLE